MNSVIRLGAREKFTSTARGWLLFLFVGLLAVLLAFPIYAAKGGNGKAGGGKDLTQFDIAPFVTLIMGDDVEACMQPIRGSMALYIGGMGAREKNFYNDYAKRLGFEEAAVKIQDLYLAGRKDEAMAAVPAELIDACHLVGPADRIKERLQRWQAAGKQGHVASMLIGSQQKEALELVAETVL